MKINKITAIVCGTLTLFTGVGTVLLALFAPQTTGYAALQGIVSSVFSGFIVSLVVPTIGYFHERNMIIEKTDSNIRSLYVNMCVISQEIGKILPQIPFAMRMESLSFKQVYELSALSIDFSNGMNLNMFVPFCKRGNSLEFMVNCRTSNKQFITLEIFRQVCMDKLRNMIFNL